MICLVACYVTSAMGGLASANAGEFYRVLQRPDWAPPGWLFGPVWMFLYTTMAVAAAMVWLRAGFKSEQTALSAFFIHLLPNALWSWLFFAWRQGAASFIVILILWAFIAYLTLNFIRVRRLSGFLLVPYWLWVTFAAVLNFRIWQINPDLL